MAKKPARPNLSPVPDPPAAAVNPQSKIQNPKSAAYVCGRCGKPAQVLHGARVNFAHRSRVLTLACLDSQCGFRRSLQRPIDGRRYRSAQSPVPVV